MNIYIFIFLVTGYALSYGTLIACDILGYGTSKEAVYAFCAYWVFSSTIMVWGFWACFIRDRKNTRYRCPNDGLPLSKVTQFAPEEWIIRCPKCDYTERRLLP